MARKRQQEELGGLMEILHYLDGGGGYTAGCSSKPPELYATAGGFY